jgi:hypothetical protein
MVETAASAGANLAVERGRNLSGEMAREKFGKRRTTFEGKKAVF